MGKEGTVAPNEAPNNFNISPKTPSEELARRYNNNDTTTFRKLITVEIITNAKELGSDIDWDYTIGSIKHKTYTIAKTGKDALTAAYGSSIGRVAVSMRLAMHDPEMVYLSGYFFTRVLEERSNFLTSQINSIGMTRNFTTKDQEAVVKERELNERNQADANLAKLQEQLNRYAQSSFTEEERGIKLDLLKQLIRHPSYKELKRPSDEHINKVLALFSAGEYEEVLRIIQLQPLY